MPAYNAEMYIKQAIQSILDQTFKRFELIVINDSSTDKTWEIITSFAKKDHRIKAVQNNSGCNIARVLNKGISLAKSNIVARMDADDIAFSDRLELQYNVITSSDRIAVVGANIVIIDRLGNQIATRSYPRTSKELKNCLFKYSSFAHPVVMFKKDMFEAVGKYNPKYSPTEDLDLWFRLGSKYEFASIPKPLLKYRLFEASSSHRAFKELELLVFTIRLRAIRRYGYRPGIYDILYNMVQFSTLWCTPANYRIKIYNILRNNNLI